MKNKLLTKTIVLIAIFCFVFAGSACNKTEDVNTETMEVSTTIVAPTTALTTTTTPTTLPESTTVVSETEAERATYGDKGVTEATRTAARTTVRTTYRTTVRTTQRQTAARTTAASHDAGCIDDGAMTY